MPHQVFISYASRDKIAADAACNVLERSGVSCWIAPRDIKLGNDWAQAIVKAIRESRVLVLVFSGNANISLHVKREVELAISRGIPVIPIRIEDTAPTESLAYFISSQHWLDAFPPPLEQHFERLAHAVKSMLDGGGQEPAASPRLERKPDRAVDDESNARPEIPWLITHGSIVGIISVGVLTLLIAYKWWTPETESASSSSPAQKASVSVPADRKHFEQTGNTNDVLKTRYEIPSELEEDLTVGDPSRDLELRNQVVVTRGHRLTILANHLTSHGGAIVTGIPSPPPASAGADGSDAADGQRGGRGGDGAQGINGSDAKEIKIVVKAFDGDLSINNSGGAGQDGGSGGNGGTGGKNMLANCLRSSARGGGGGRGGDGANVGVGGAGGSGGNATAKLNREHQNSNGVVGGDGGNGGTGGDGGHGGPVIIRIGTVTADSLLHVDSRPGAGGRGGAGGDTGWRGPGGPCASVDESIEGPPVIGGDGGNGGASLVPGNILLFVENPQHFESTTASLEFRNKAKQR